MRAERTLGGGAATRVAIALAILALCVPVLMPAVWMLSTAFKTDGQILRGDGALLPRPPDAGNFARALAAAPLRPLPAQHRRPVPRERRQRGGLQRGRRVRLRPRPLPRLPPPLLRDARHHGPARPGHDGPRVRPLPVAGLVRHAPAARRALVLRRAVLRVPARAVLPHPSGGDGGERAARRRERVDRVHTGFSCPSPARPSRRARCSSSWTPGTTSSARCSI